MAIVTNATDRPPEIRPITSLPAPQQVYAHAPVGTWYVGNTTSLAAKGAGDQTAISLTSVFPRDFAYTLTHASFSLLASDATGGNFAPFGYMTLRNTDPKSGTAEHMSVVLRSLGAFNWSNTLQVGQAYTPEIPLPNKIYRPAQGDQFDIRAQFNDTDAGATGASTFVYVLCGNLYSLLQEENYVMNQVPRVQV